MRNKLVGYIIIGIGVIIGIINFSYNRLVLELAGDTCSITGPSCPHLQAMNEQLLVNGLMLGVILLVGIYLIFFSREEKIITKIKKIKDQVQSKKLTKENYEQVMQELDADEKNVLDKVIDARGSVFQSELVKKTGFTKVRITRILDKLEGIGLIERKRRGMTNVVILKA